MTENRLCYDYARGDCKRNNCKFSHGGVVPDGAPRTPGRRRGGRGLEGTPGTQGTPGTPGRGGRGRGRGDAPSTPSRGGGTPSRGGGTPSRGGGTPSRGGGTSSRGGGTPSRGPTDDSETAYREWRRGLGRDGAIAQTELNPSQMKSFLQDAITILESGSADAKQFLVKDLGSDRGLLRIKQIVETDFALPYSVLRPMFKSHCILFLTLISHEEILSSLVLEAAVGTMYNVIYGHDGQRGIAFFKRVSINLVCARGNPEACYGLEDEDSLEEALSATTAALLSTFKLNQGAAVQNEFKGIVQNLRACYSQDETKHISYAIRSAHQDMERIMERLQMGEAIASVQSVDSGAAPGLVMAQKFQMAVDLPGSYSRAGIRHDNDFGLINNIKILPTTSEIKAERDEFLPLRGTNSPHHLVGIHRLLDSQFRLLREDTSGQLRDGVRHLFDNWDVLVTGKDARAKKKVQRQSQTRIRMYDGARLERLKCDRKKGLCIDVSFDQPKNVAGLGKKKRIEWWENSKELQMSSLVGLIGNDKETTFLLVSIRTVDPPRTENPNEEPDPSFIDDLTSNDRRAVITLSLADPNSVLDQSRLISLTQSQNTMGFVMIEFPGILLVSFEPVLKCLQNLHRNPTLPFTKWIIPQPERKVPLRTLFSRFTLGGYEEGTIKIPPPLYLAKNRIPLNLRCITKNNQPLTFSIDNPATIPQLLEKTTLDRGQCEALITGLNNELALIQGPPGTGKSYVGLQLARVLLANRDQTKIGPIICVCYTNHALDQFLEDLVKNGVPQVVRLGGRSKSPILEKNTLQAISKTATRTKAEKREVWQCMKGLDEVQVEMGSVCAQISRLTSSSALRDHLSTEHPQYYTALFGRKSEEGWTEVVKKGNMIDNWVQGRGIRDGKGGARAYTTNRTVTQLLQANQANGTIPSLWTMSLIERARLKANWEQEMRESIEQELRDAVSQHSEASNTLKQQYRESDKRCLEQAFVIGCTTTGLATSSELLRSLQSKVLICEEAAEVLEAHVLTALLPSVQHAILIGDHLQLRPQVSNYQLSVESERGKEYGLDVSLFERLADERFGKANEKFPIAKLDTQRRMHPSISSLVRETLYPGLQDDPHTHAHPDVTGMRRKLFWLDHRVMEDSAGDGESGSKTNEWEADMVVALVKHLSRQGVYGSKDIAVLTPYLGQFQKIKKKLQAICDLIVGDKDQEQLDLEEDSDPEELPKVSVKEVQKGKLFDAVVVSTVDNFQGDEAKVIIVSLVRSNVQRNCGFLKTPNRINVLLSRARDGMYIIGNAETSGKVEMWSKVIGLLEADNNIGTELQLRCPRHPDHRIAVSIPEDFLIKSPEGGCAEICGLRLDCGHVCVMKCHSGPLHKAVDCMEACIRQFPECGHSCPKRCWEKCGLCTLKIYSVPLPCGHTAASLKCHEKQNIAQFRCQQTVTKKVILCGHEVKASCSTDVKKIRCTTICGDILPCGHECKRFCWNCKVQSKDGLVVNHGSCINPCGRSFTTCNHKCRKVCHGAEPCSPCDLPCEVRCGHSKCGKKCSDPCPPCAEQCTWTCAHRERCTMPCAVPCDIIPCSKRCENILSCQHQCPGVCGEACPGTKYCKECASPEILEKTVDFIMYDTYADVDVEENPIIFLTCGHFYTVSTLDGLMDLKESYVIDEKGKILGPKPASGVASGQGPKGCPECRKPLRDIHRYNRVVKLALLDEATRRFVANAREVYMKLVNDVVAREKALKGERKAFIKANPQVMGNSDPAGPSRAIKGYKRTNQALLNKTNAFTTSMARNEQPFGRINSLIVDAKRRRNIDSSFAFDEAIIQTGFQYRGQAVSLRLNWAVLWDLNTIYNDTSVDQCVRDKLLPDILGPISALKKRCLNLRKNAEQANLPQHQIEARVYQAQFVALELSHQAMEPAPAVGQAATTEGQTAQEEQPSREAVIAVARLAEVESLVECTRICARFPGTTSYLKDDIRKASGLLNGITFYSFVSNKEKEEVYRAMAGQFSGTGHWYYCQNNHPFTVGECGMPMELARCPECGAQVGGQNHVPEAGVSRATDLDAQFAGTGTPAAAPRGPVAAAAALFGRFRI